MGILDKFITGAMETAADILTDSEVGLLKSLTDPGDYESRDAMDDDLEKALGYSPYHYWNEMEMGDIFDDILTHAKEDQYDQVADKRDEIVNSAIIHYENIRGSFARSIVHNTILNITEIDIQDEDSEIDLNYLIASDIFGLPEDDDDEIMMDDDEEETSLNDELKDDEDEDDIDTVLEEDEE